jgi:3-oxoadipate enol-lactonase
MPIFTYNDININYILEGNGKSLVLIPGIGQKLTGWFYQIPFFKQKMKVIAIDNRGVGKSSRPNYPYTMEMFILDLKNLLNYLNIQDKIHLCGHSLGGMIAQQFTLRYPNKVKTLILMATAAYIDPSFLFDQIKTNNQNYSSERVYIAFLKMLPALYSRPFRKKLKEKTNLFERLKDDWMENSTRGQDFINQGNAVLEHDTRNSLYKIKQPTLIIASKKDRLQSVSNSHVIYDKVPNAELVILDDLGHLFNIEDPEKINNIIWNFIKKHNE